MLLAVDCGNTNTVFAVFDDAGEMVGEWRTSTNANRTADEIGAWLVQIMALDGIDRRGIDAAIIATVVPATLFALRRMCRHFFGCEGLVVRATDTDVGLEVLVDSPQELGADRLVNAVAARDAYGTPVMVVDFGTATTFDVLDDRGRYVGGAIAPGVNLSLEALHQASAQLPRVAIGRPDRTVATNTVQAMRSGIFWGYVGLVEGIVRRIKEEMSGSGMVVATGGLAPLFTDSTPVIDLAEPNLTLRGLLLIHRRVNG